MDLVPLKIWHKFFLLKYSLHPNLEAVIPGVIVQVGPAHKGAVLPGAVPQALHAPVRRGLAAVEWYIWEGVVGPIVVESVIVPHATVGVVGEEVRRSVGGDRIVLQ